MAIDADEWQAFYERSREVKGPVWAATLVRAIPPSGADALATKADIAALEERFGLRMTAEMAELRGELRIEMAELRGDVRTEIAGVRASIEEKLRGQTWRLSGLLVATLGVGITLARLA